MEARGRLLPIGTYRDFMISLAYQYGALFIALLLAPVVVARWRLSLWLAPLGLRPRASSFPLFVLASLGLWVFAAYPLVVHFESSWFVRLILSVPLVLFLGLLAATFFGSIISKPVNRLAHAAAVLAALPACPLAAVALFAVLPLHQASEKCWLAQETLLRIDPDAPDLGAYEFRLAAQKRRETNAILGME